MNAFDKTLFHALNQFAGHSALDPVMKFFAQYALELYALLFIVAWFTLPRNDEDRRHGLILGVAGGVIALGINLVIGSIWYRPRPFVAMPDQVHRIIPHSVDASFPSDHVSGGFGFTSGTWGEAPNWVSRSFLVISLITMVARVYVGVHWPTDVLGGVVVGLFSGWIARRLSRPLRVITNIGLRIFRMGRFARRRRYARGR
ncbi:phosphatase PAP2 family protein [Alicyclobacillus sp.]|uniref:phosphatase PAP2 family protein n=1 Tax=Alicyclobacillus sp. TaxID=61169 RepID=UPI0025BCD00B|nr:phosphatase PAP2 family protein [Alicyclobacillus sp.]MCL6516685.1 phosphatase PAP2 family protein [Alicyclobacillus sp.]